MKYIFFSLCFFCFIQQIFAYNYDDRYAIGEETYDPITFPELIKIIDELPVKSIESLLPNLKAREPQMFRDYILMYRSRSLQTAAFAHPRTILTGKDAHLMLAYNGHPRQKGFHNLEVISFDNQKKRFTFHEITFEEGNYHVSEPNPQKCLNCHQASTRSSVDPRPNWEPYNVWPGAYGSVGHISDVNDKRNEGSPRYIPLLGELNAQEEDRIDYFFKYSYKTNARYQLLEPMMTYGAGKEYFSPPVNDPNPNNMPTRITRAINHINFQRVARIMQETPIFDDYKITLIAALKCQYYYMPEELYQWHRQNYVREKEYNFGGTYRSKSDEHGGFIAKSLAEAISLIFEPHGIDTSDWSSDFGSQGLFAANNRFGGPTNVSSELKTSFLKVWGKNEKTLYDDYSCRDLAQMSREKLTKFWQKFKNNLPIQQPATAKVLLTRCQKCHGYEHMSYDAPYIPFHKPKELKNELYKDSNKRRTLYDEISYRLGPHATFTERMPADGHVPSKQEIDAFMKYLESL